MTVSVPKSIKFVITDFDGIITDNCVYIDSKGDFSRKINFKDIMAFSILKKSGYKVGIISGEKNAAIDKISDTFKIDEVFQNIRTKIDVLKQIVTKYKLNEDEFIYIGDDINDYDSLIFTKHAYTVPNAVDKIKSINGIHITESRGGDGAFREIVDCLLKD